MSVTYEKGPLARVYVDGRLDQEAAATLADVVGQALADVPRRLEIDLTGVTTYSSAGAQSVSQALRLRGRFDDGVGIIVATEAGRRILLESMTFV